MKKTVTLLQISCLFRCRNELNLPPLEGESIDKKTTTTEYEARLDIKATGLWETGFIRPFLCEKFNPYAKSCPRTIKDAYKLYEAQKLLNYEQRIVEVENSSSNPLVFVTTGGAAPTASEARSRLEFKLSEKSEDTHAELRGYIRTEVSFALVKKSVLCLGGCRSLKQQSEINDSELNRNRKTKTHENKNGEKDASNVLNREKEPKTVLSGYLT